MSRLGTVDVSGSSDDKSARIDDRDVEQGRMDGEAQAGGAVPAAPLIDFWFDFGSPYGYFASESIDALAARHGRSVRWRPILLFAVLRGLGLPNPFETPAKLAYSRLDFARSARFLGLPYRLPTGFPIATQLAARAFYLIDQRDPRAAVTYARTVFRDYFAHDRPIGKLEHISALAARAGLADGDPLVAAELLKSDPAKALLAKAVDEAVVAQAFGSPFIVVDGEPFFGVDRLPQIEAALSATSPTHAGRPQEIQP
ncbi:MAG: 2-hydroxychromene-2-carboxylate isomerase [Rhizobacter sp.]|nr:2-hydroxychromene-2-carboxylate isomerase [Rhizobacter sp.]